MTQHRHRQRSLALLTAILLVPPMLVMGPTGPMVSPAEASTTIGGSEPCAQTVSGTLTGAVEQEGNDCVVAFKSGSGEWTVPSGVAQIDYVVAGGGGGGGRGSASDHGGGGGGAGGVVQGTGLGVAAGSAIKVAVGEGGAGGTGSGDNAGKNGGESSLKDAQDNPLRVAAGGGRGGASDSVAQSGASGGGGAALNNLNGAAGTGGQGFAGGSVTSSSSNLNKNAAGGGGAGGAAESTSGRPDTDPLGGSAGDGGVGVRVSWLATDVANDLGVGAVSGSDVYFGGGGGGGAGSGEAEKADGGLGGGGAGGYFTDSRTSNGVESGNNGLPNTGGGGGGGTGAGGIFFGPGGSGGSGVVIVRFALPAGDLGCAAQPTTVGNFQVVTFTAVGACEWSVPDGVNTVDVLVVGGGGGGGARIGGGGGGGGVTEQTVGLTGTDTVSVTVGAGGAGGTPEEGTILGRPGASGGPSAFGAVTSRGGGGGGGSGTNRNGLDGATGGGGGFNNVAGTGDPGGDGGAASAVLSDVVVLAGGGGGSSENGADFSGDSQAGAGGIGTLSTISGASLRYGGGGGGGVHTGVVRQANPGVGGDGGGGAGAFIAFSEGETKGSAGQAGTDGRGGGGGGGSVTDGNPATPTGGKGGSGVVIIRWATTPFNITIVDSGGAEEGAGWAESGGVISATRDVSIDADVIEAKLAQGPLLVDGRNIHVQGAISYAGTASTLTLRGTQRVQVAGSIESTSGPLNVVLWSDSEDTGSGGVSIVNGATITTNGGHVWAGGTSEPEGSGTWNGLTVGDGPSVGAEGFNYYSLDFQGSIVSAGGDVLLWAGDARTAGDEGIAVKTFDSSNNPSINTGTGDLTLITKQLFNWDNTNASLEVTTTGTLTIAPDQPNRWSEGFNWARTTSESGSVFTLTTIGGSGQPLVVNDIASVGGLVIGDHENVQPSTGDVTISSDVSIAGPITIHSDSIAINKALTSTGSGDASRISLVGAAANNLNGTVSMSSGSITAENLLIQNIHNTSLSTGGSVSVGTLAAEGGHRLLLVNDGALTVGEVGGVSGISDYTEFVTLATKTGDLTVSQPVGTTGSSSSFQLRVTAGRDTAFGTSTGGDVKVTGAGAFVVPNAVTQVFSGSAVNSTGLSALADAETVSTTAPGVAVGEVAVAYRAGPPSFQSPTSVRFGETLSLVVSEPSGGDVTLSKVNAGDPCTLSGSTITPTGVGDCVVQATGDASGFSAQ